MSISHAQTISPVDSNLQSRFSSASLEERGQKAFDILAAIAENPSETDHPINTPEGRHFIQKLATLIEKGHHTKALELIEDRMGEVSLTTLTEELEYALDRAYNAYPSNAQAFEAIPQIQALLTQQPSLAYRNEPPAPTYAMAA